MQQIIPYILILDESGQKIFTTKRIAGDIRLVDKVSINSIPCCTVINIHCELNDIKYVL